MRIGDEVIIKDRISIDKRFVCPEMMQYCGKLAKIVDIYVDNHYNTYYSLDIDNHTYAWTNGTIELAPESITVNIPEGYVFDKVTENNKILIKRDKKELPKTWEECIKELNKGEFISNFSDVIEETRLKDERSNHNVLPKGLGEPMLALMQLLLCREVYRQGWKPNWTTKEGKYCIVNVGEELQCVVYEKISYILSFQSAEVRDEFLNNFRDLIEEAKELILAFNCFSLFSTPVRENGCRTRLREYKLALGGER